MLLFLFSCANVSSPAGSPDDTDTGCGLACGDADADTVPDTDTDTDTDADTDTDTDTDSPADRDRDGYTEEQGDCNDNDPEISPGATEICNLIDDDCDGLTDEDVKVVRYDDDDGDGYGDPSTRAEVCDPGAGVDNGDDCNDRESDAFPGNTEGCDAIDNDCDGAVDEELQDTFYADDDGDGYGDASASTEACSAPRSYVSDATDCDDTDDGTYPGAPEICDDVDDDCNGVVDDDCRNDFSGTWTLDTPITYTCFDGLIDFSFDSFEFADDYPDAQATLGFTFALLMTGVMTGTFSSELEFTVTEADATYGTAAYHELNGTFTDTNTMEGTWISGLSGFDSSGLPFGCVDGEYPFTATR